jgi:hypothetical protein
MRALIDLELGLKFNSLQKLLKTAFDNYFWLATTALGYLKIGEI